ncbi:hypothetical protein FPT84_25130 [Salmonella enterica]|uniref:ProQ/FinO domain-containing protein n=1 Tax=Salmonella enterica I TaxID=59201 RepID=A0A5U3G5I4_SALET|nr:hypothetical protein CHD70_27655 [Salmonella enterica]EBP4061068.1 hypothetical protein [Salmonella enterica subsp. enterica]EDP2158889.1 hypothetical protein [Salmonella enterica subsp. enterica serovar Kisarawe]EAS5879187.1 hypothetical protein [Salmonella enterica]EAU6767296.1 hypothetical protein [Salmonella enterica]
MTAGSVKNSPVVVVKKKRPLTPAPLTGNSSAEPVEQKTTHAIRPQPHPSGLNKKQRKLLRRKQIQREMRREIWRNGRQKLPLFRQVFPLLWPDDNAFRLMKVGIFLDAEKYVNENPGCGLSVHDCRCVFAWVTSRLAYLSLFSPGAVRHDLHGRPAGSVSDEQIRLARLSSGRILHARAQKHAPETEKPSPENSGNHEK